jgi:hypothetical protein
MSISSTTCPASDALAAVTDEQRLVDFIREQATATHVDIQTRKRLSGGAIQENWLLELLIEGGPWAGARRWLATWRGAPRPHLAPPDAIDPPDPEMQMNFYNFSQVLYLLERSGVQRAHLEFTNHGGCVGAYVYFQRT